MVGIVLGALVWRLSRLAVRFRVTNYSMLPTLSPGDRVLVDELAYRWRAPRRGEIVVFKNPERAGAEGIKRVVGLPGERIVLRAGELYVDGRPQAEPYLDGSSSDCQTHEWLLGEDEYLLLGDNRAASRDSRHFGPVRRGLLRGPALYRYAPAAVRGRAR